MLTTRIALIGAGFAGPGMSVRLTQAGITESVPVPEPDPVAG